MNVPVVDEMAATAQQLPGGQLADLVRSRRPLLSPGFGLIAENLALSAIYLACGNFGLSLAFVHASASAVWPPTGLALAALLLRGCRLWPGIFVGAFLVNIAANGSVAACLGIAAGNTCEALAGAWLVGRFAAGVNVFQTTVTFFRFLILAAVLSTTISPAIGVTSLCVGGLASWNEYGAIWLTWWLGDLVSDLIIAPFLMVWATRGVPRLKPRELLEAVALIIGVVLVGLAIFFQGNTSPIRNYPLTYLALVPLLWAAFRFGARGAITAAFVMDLIALWATLRHWGPFASADPNHSLLFLQTFIGTAAVTSLALALAVSERKRSEERLALVIQGSNDGIWDWDLAANKVYFSSRWKSMLGYADNEVEHRFCAWERLLHPADRERALASIQAYLTGQTPAFELEHRLRHKDGSYRWILSRGVALRDPSNKPVRMAGSHVDLTARKETEEQLRRAYAELSGNETMLKAALLKVQSVNQELQATQLQLIQAAKFESVGTLAAGVAHEVKNPLQTLLMGIDYLSKNPAYSGGDSSVVLSDMRDAVTRANSIVRELLQLSAASDFELKPADLNRVIERSLWLMQNEITASQIRVVRRLGADLPPVALDHSKMEQVLINLFLNALQAMSHGGVLSVTTRHRRFGGDLKMSGPAFAQFKQGEVVVIAEVQDTGKGIPEADLPRIFDPFFTTKPNGVGTGLGLSVVKKILDLHGGAIVIRNAPLGGAVVTMVFKAEADEKPRAKM